MIHCVFAGKPSWPLVLVTLVLLALVACGAEADTDTSQEQMTAVTSVMQAQSIDPPPEAPLRTEANPDTASAALPLQRVKIIQDNLTVLEPGPYTIIDRFTGQDRITEEVITEVQAQAGEALDAEPPYREVNGVSFEWTHEISREGRTILLLRHQYPLDNQSFTYREARLDRRSLRVTNPEEPIAVLTLEEWTARGITRLQSRQEEQSFQVELGLDLDQSGSIEASEMTLIQETAQGRKLEVVSPEFRTRLRELPFQIRVEDQDGVPIGEGNGTWLFGMEADYPADARLKPGWSLLTLMGVRFQTVTSSTGFPLPNPFRQIPGTTSPGDQSVREVLVWIPE